MTVHRFILIFGLIIICSQLSYSQLFRKNKITVSMAAVVHYNDGSVFVGRIVEESPLAMDLMLSTGDTISLNKTYIHRIKRGDQNISLYNGAKFHYTKGYFITAQLGGNASFNDWDGGTDQFELIGGYRFSKSVAAGLGIGVSFNSTNTFGTWIEASAVPVFTYGRFYLADKRMKPFVATKLGWAFPDNNAFGGDHRGGMLFQPEIGVNFASRRRIRWLLTVGQQLQNIRGNDLNFDQFGNPINSNFNIWFNRTVIKVGIEWK